MAINKVAGKPSKKHGGLRNVLEYVLRDQKVKEGYVVITGPYSAETINYDEIYRQWLAEKRLWGKDTGRMYAHNIISFHADEHITPTEVLEIGIQFAEFFFPDHQSVIAVHQDKENTIHCHIVSNSVSFVDGRKLHQNKHDLQEQKEFTNQICRERGFSVAQKGRHFDGTEIEPETILSWNKNAYKLLTDSSKKSYLVDLAQAINDAKRKSYSREDFINNMKNHGWDVRWEDRRKHIIFQNEAGKKVRDSNISKTFSMDISKETLTNDFIRKTEKRQQLQSAVNSRGFADQIGRSVGKAQTAGIYHSRI